MRALGLALALTLPAATAVAAGFTVTSKNIPDGATVPMPQVFNAFGCKGQNVSPQLSWSGEPAGTQSFAITMYDPDAPTGSGWWHWTVFDIPPTVHSLPEGAGSVKPSALPAGAVQGRTDFGFSHYGGPCPPAGDKPHRYIITVYAVKLARLPLDAQASGAEVGYNLHFDAVAETHITGHYGRSR